MTATAMATKAKTARKLSDRTKEILKMCGLKAVPAGKTKPATVVLFQDDSCEMAKIEVNGKGVYEGNEWDFHPGCHGTSFDFRGSGHLFDIIESDLSKAGYEVESRNEAYTYEY